MIVRCEKKTGSFAAYANEPFVSRELSLTAKAVLRLMLGRPDNWCFHLSEITTHFPCGGYSIRKAVEELRTAGYVKSFGQQVNRGRFPTRRLYVRESLSIDMDTAVASLPGASVLRLDKATRRSLGYSATLNAPFVNPALSARAKGLLAFLLCQSPGYDVNVKSLARLNGIGDSVCRKLLSELQKAGHLRRSARKDAVQRFCGWQFRVYEEPVATNESSESGEYRRTKNGTSVNQVLLSTKPNLTNKDIPNPLPPQAGVGTEMHTQEDATVAAYDNPGHGAQGRGSDPLDNIARRVAINAEFSSLQAAYPPGRARALTSAADRYSRRRRAQLRRQDTMPPIEDLLQAVDSLKCTEKWAQAGGRFIPHLQNFIKNSGWEEAWRRESVEPAVSDSEDVAFTFDEDLKYGMTLLLNKFESPDVPSADLVHWSIHEEGVPIWFRVAVSGCDTDVLRYFGAQVRDELAARPGLAEFIEEKYPGFGAKMCDWKEECDDVASRT
jgi:hypothetical protein